MITWIQILFRKQIKLPSLFYIDDTPHEMSANLIVLVTRINNWRLYQLGIV